MAKTDLTAQRLRELLHYDPETGKFTRLKTMSSRAHLGAEAGTLGVQGYMVVCLNYADYRMHRLAWLYMTGIWPDGDIDHINGIRSDNKWVNLRCVSRSVNMENQKRAKSGNKSGFLGVTPNGTGFMANIRIDGKQTYLGTFRNASDAHAAYLVAKRKHHEGCTI